MTSHVIRIGIAGYGNLGRGVLAAIAQQPDMQLVSVFTRRDPATVKLPNPAVPVKRLQDAQAHRLDIDVMILCGGSKDDLPVQGPELAQWFNTVDSFDTHPKIPQYFQKIDDAARAGGNLSLISVGWDPGLFSVNRVMAEAILPQGTPYTFWGKGVSQGHSDAIRHVAGVRNGVQYTVPIQAALDRVRVGENPQLSTREKHTRECFVVLESGADPKRVEHDIATMPDYFADYDTTVHFISEAELKRDHTGMPHGGFAMRSGQSGTGDPQVVEFSLKLASNPGFTANVLVAYARAAWRMKAMGQTGACTVLDVAPGWLSPKPAETLRKELL
ncbi:MAG: diaminopimelate dehydrogenase [Castellaniella sp.]|uniref:diaminopimelate dehydrogenase n=1 Tax=Castellaniella sp. TaxID=1955812 RepID=UPI0012158219|nr:diaminopimelate dehydrogenase [Castellaniella sp.]TAN30939.1 MAG: diaminopimelate dehydrogenase [Castellaniella sp.]